MNIRSDPFESFDTKDSYGHLAQKVSWIFEPITELLEDAFEEPRRVSARAGRHVVRPVQRRGRFP